MRALFFALIFLPWVCFAELDLNHPDLLRQRCDNRVVPTLGSGDFRWDYSLPELIQRAFEIRVSGKKVPARAFFDVQKNALVLPYAMNLGGNIELPSLFLKSVQRHIETALRLSYVQGIFFPDMGHSHLLIPQKLWDEKYSKMPAQEQARRYEAFFADPEIKIFYHTAEQLKMTDESGVVLPGRDIQWRFYSRNLAGDNRGEGRLELLQNPKSPLNTVSAVPGYRWWGGGFYMSESDQGCIAFQHEGEVRYFDLSLQYN